MKSIPLLAAFYLLSVSSAKAQMAMIQIAKPRDSLNLKIRTQPGDAPISEATYVTSAQGTLKLPQLKQEIPAAGIQFHTLVIWIKEAFAASGIQPVPSVKKTWFPGVSTPNHPVTVSGNVQHPREIARRQGMTLMAAIDKAGGFTKTADPSRVKVIRAKKETIYDLRKIKPDGSNNPLLMDEDQIIVPAVSAMPAWPGLLKPGDSIFIELKNPAEDLHKITSIYTISAPGTLKLPMLQQEISAVGISATTLTLRIEAAYTKAGIYKSPMFHVTRPDITEYQGPSENAVNVGGEIRISGKFALRSGMTLMNAIIRAGGFTEFAEISRVKLKRANEETIYDLGTIKPDGSNNPVLMDGDLVVVPAK